MKNPFAFVVGLTFTLCLSVASAQAAAAAAHAKPRVCSACIRANEEFLASDAMQGRGDGTQFELLAATYVAAQLRAYGVQPAGDDGGYIQSAPITKRTPMSPPTIEITPAHGSPLTLTYGKDFLLHYITSPEFSGKLRKINTDNEPNPKIEPGTVVLATGSNPGKIQGAAMDAAGAGGTVTVFVTGPAKTFAEMNELPQLPILLKSGSGGMSMINFFQISPDVAQTLSKIDDGANVKFNVEVKEEDALTWNAVGILKGTDPKLRHKAILLSAHLDHLGVGKPVNGDRIYNGADDDASGTAAVLELARVLGAGPRPRRTVIFALFGSEESGGLGSTYFREHPPIPLQEFSANLEFEMIGRADAKVPADTLWLTGWERSNLGSTLAAHGAHLVGDPHPEQNFFARSDNYVLATKGVVAQTVSSYGLHHDYHQPSDDIAHLDFKHMDAAIGSMLAPVQWLVNSDFTPLWNKNGQP